MEDGDDHRGGEEPAEHEDVAVGEVDELEDAVDERVAERDERVESAFRQSDERDVDEVRRPLHEVDHEPGDQQCDEQERDHGHDVRAGRLPPSSFSGVSGVSVGSQELTG